MWREQLEEGVGKWLEVAKIPVRQLETLYASENHEAGMSNFASTLKKTDQHGYWGAMRDRITATEEDAFLPTLPDSVLAMPKRHETRGKRLRVKAPDNLCFIRTAQNWSDSQEDERTTYLEIVAPVLAAGIRSLCDEPQESGCCLGRFLRECDLKTGNPLDKTCMAAYFLSLGHLERWAKTHPAHLNIYNSFMQMVQKHNFQISLKLWHEVWVVPGCNLHLEYNNCHSATGLLPLGEVEQLEI